MVCCGRSLPGAVPFLVIAQDYAVLVLERAVVGAVVHECALEANVVLLGEFFSWLYVIMRNFRLMDLRKNEPEILPVGAPQDLPEVPDAKLAEALSSVDAETVRAAVRNLPDIQSEVLVLRFLEGRSMEEISAMIGIPVGTVKSRLHNAKAALRDALTELRNGGATL